MWKRTIRSQILIMVTVLIVISSLSLSVVIYQISAETLIEQIGNNRVDILKQISKQALQLKNTAQMVSNLYYYDNVLIDYLNGSSNMTETEINVYLDDLTKRIHTSLQFSEQSFEVAVIGENGYRYNSVEQADYPYDYIKTRIWYTDLTKMRPDLQWVANFRKPDTQENMYSVARLLPTQQKHADILLIGIQELHIREAYSQILTGDNYIYLVDSAGTIISSNNLHLLGFNFFDSDELRNIFEEDPYVLTNIADRQVLFTGHYDSEAEWFVLEEIPQSDILQPVQQLQIPLILATCFAVIISAVVAILVSNRITHPIRELSKYVLKRDTARVDEEFQINGVYEIMVLRDGMMQMLNRIQKLMDDAIEHEKKRRNMELRLLQAQINPHFIYNTLFSIQCTIQMDKKDDAVRMLSSFISILRNTLTDINEFTTLMDEFKMLKEYISLQQYRYGHSFVTETDLDTRFYNYKIPKLLLQPIVENAIFHGIATAQNGLLKIRVYDDENHIFINIADNGVGMNEEKLKQISNDEVYTKSGGLGLGNIRERMVLFFGKSSSMEIESHAEIGTSVTLKFPKME